MADFALLAGRRKWVVSPVGIRAEGVFTRGQGAQRARDDGNGFFRIEIAHERQLQRAVGQPVGNGLLQIVKGQRHEIVQRLQREARIIVRQDSTLFCRQRGGWRCAQALEIIADRSAELQLRLRTIAGVGDRCGEQLHLQFEVARARASRKREHLTLCRGADADAATSQQGLQIVGRMFAQSALGQQSEQRGRQRFFAGHQHLAAVDTRFEQDAVAFQFGRFKIETHIVGESDRSNTETRVHAVRHHSPRRAEVGVGPRPQAKVVALGQLGRHGTVPRRADRIGSALRLAATFVAQQRVFE